MHSRRARKLFEQFPQHLRNRDAGEGRPLEALAALLAEELLVVEQDIDQLYDNWFIETCEPWAIPYIAELVGARTLRDFGKGEGGLRRFVANTLRYRQAKGTAAVLEELARDVTGWSVVAVEFFQKLVWSQNVNHVRPDAPGTASVRDSEAARAAHGPFDPACHVAAAGRANGWSGRFNLPNIGLFVWRLDAYPLGFLVSKPDGYLGGPLPRASAFGPGLLHFDPLGADRPLHNLPQPDRSIAARVDERVLPAALDRRRLHLDLNALRDEAPGGGRWFDDPPAVEIRLDGATLPPEKLFSCNLEARPDGAGGFLFERPQNPGEAIFDPQLGRLSLHPDDEGKTVETAHAYAMAFDLGGGPYDRTASVEEWRGSFFPERKPPPWRVGVSRRAEDKNADPAEGVVVDTFAAALTLWNAEAVAGTRGIITIFDNASYPPKSSINRTVRMPPGARLAIVAADWPLVDPESVRRVRDPTLLSAIHRRPHIRANLLIEAEDAAGVDGPATLILDGLLLEGEIVVQDGDLGTLEIRHSTVGAGANGLKGGVRVAAGNAGLAIALRHAIAGSIDMNTAGGGLSLCDSIVGEDRTAGEDPDTMAVVVSAPNSDTSIERSTVFGRCGLRTIEASDSLMLGRVRVAHRQAGCVRFSFATRSSRLPRRYRCAPDLAIEAEAARLGRSLKPKEAAQIERRVYPRFARSDYPAAAFGQLSLACAGDIRIGAYAGGEMGAGYSAAEPARRANLADAIREYLPLGLEAAPLFVN